MFFYTTTEPISTELGIKHPWGKGIQVFANKGPFQFSNSRLGFFLLMYYHSFAQMYLFIGTVSQVSYVAHGSLVTNIILVSIENCHVFKYHSFCFRCGKCYMYMYIVCILFIIQYVLWIASFFSPNFGLIY